MYRGIYTNLLAQFESLYVHNRQGSIKTKRRYREAWHRYLAFLAEKYRLEKIANIAPKHIYAYVELLTEKGRSTAYLKTELSAIRFFHAQIPRAKHKLPSNEDLGLGRRQYGGVDRTWSGGEFNRALAVAMRQDREDYAAIMTLGRYAALRLHECFRLDTNSASKAIKTGVLTTKGKGGLVREIPINLSIQIELRKMLERTPRGHKLFVGTEDKTHQAMHRFESFLSYHKAEIQDPGSTRPLHFHGLRHTSAVEWYEKFVGEGMNEKAARLAVAKLLGHGRDGVTKVYLASIQ